MKSLVVAYDGKGGRMVKADVLLDLWFATKIRLREWADPQGTFRTVWVLRRPMRRAWQPGWMYLLRRSSWYWGRGGWLRGDRQLMRMMFGMPGDWYSVIGTFSEVQQWDLGHRTIQNAPNDENCSQEKGKS